MNTVNFTTCDNFQSAYAYTRETYGADMSAASAAWQLASNVPGWEITTEKQKDSNIISVMFSVDGVQHIDTKAATMTLDVRIALMWNATTLGCSPWEDAGNQNGSTCPGWPDVKATKKPACFLHPPGISPSEWTKQHAALRGSAGAISCGCCDRPAINNPFLIESFESQFWFPKAYPSDVVEAIDIPGGSFIETWIPSPAAAAWDGGRLRCTDVPRILYMKRLRITVRVKMDLRMFPFDKQDLEVQLAPASSEMFPAYVYLPDVHDPCVGMFYDTQAFNTQNIGQKPRFDPHMCTGMSAHVRV